MRNFLVHVSCTFRARFEFTSFQAAKDMEDDEYSFEPDENDVGLLLDENDESFAAEFDDAHEAAEIADAEKKERKGYLVLTRSDLQKEMQKISAEVMDSLSVSSEEAFLLLRHFKYVTKDFAWISDCSWEKEKLFDHWFADDPASVAKSAGVLIDNIEEESHGVVCSICRLLTLLEDGMSNLFRGIPIRRGV